MRPSIVYSGFCISEANGAAFSIGRTRSTKNVRVLVNVSSADAARIVDVLVQHAAIAGALQRVGQRLRVGAAAERQQLHEQPAFGPLRLAVLVAAFFADVGRLGSAARSVDAENQPSR